MTPNGIIEAVDVAPDRPPGFGTGLEERAHDQLGFQGLAKVSTRTLVYGAVIWMKYVLPHRRMFLNETPIASP